MSNQSENTTGVSSRMKARSDSKLHGLNEEHRARVDRWLFAENQSYEDVMRRCREELGLELGVSSVKRYHTREKARWELEQKVQVNLKATSATDETVDAEELYRKLLGRMMRIALTTAEESKSAMERKVVTDYAKVLISARRESHEALRVATTREKFEFDAATACLVHQVKIQGIVRDESLNDGERIQRIREELFGEDLPE